MEQKQQKVWFVTGASKGLGHALVSQLLQKGYKVAATSRNAADLKKHHKSDDSFHPLTVDLANQDSVQAAIDSTIAFFGRLDVLVNNAGYGIGGTLEELTNKEIQDAFDINVFGTINTIRAAMPQLRKQGSGHIINISSIAGFAPPSGWAAYGAAKAAVIGMSDALAEDVKEFGIKVTVVMPGGFRTSFLKPESLVNSKKQMPEYTNVRAIHERYKTIDGKQSGDPEKAPDVFIDLAENPNPPVRLFMGSDAIKRALDRTEATLENIKQFETVSRSTDVSTD